MHTVFAFLLSGVIATMAWAHGEKPHAKSDAAKSRPALEDTAFGRPGDAKRVSRTIRVDMSDRMRFAPDALVVKRGETIRFEVSNSGKILHEMVIGTAKELKEHAELMKKFPNMEHDEPYMAHVDPGKRATMIWQFSKPGTFFYGCLVPGHFEAGMVGRIEVRP